MDRNSIPGIGTSQAKGQARKSLWIETTVWVGNRDHSLVRLVRACGSKHPDDCCAGIIMFGQARKSLWIEVLLAQRDVDSGDKRSADEICQQELKNAVCITLKEKGAQEKGSLMKNVIRTMGYARSSTSLVEAAEKGMKYGRKTGEIVQDEEKRFRLGN